jgi:hypothetical protein
LIRKRIGFRWSGLSFALTLDQQNEPWEAGPGVLTVHVENQPKLSLKVTHGPASPYPLWAAMELREWQPGDWIDAFQSCASKVQAGEAHWNQSYEAFLFNTATSDIDLDNLGTQLTKLRALLASGTEPGDVGSETPL